MKKYAHWAWPGSLISLVGLLAFMVHVLWREPALPDLFSVVSLLLIFFGGIACFVGTLGRIEQVRDGDFR